jgi:hypothetical protein
LLVLHLHRKRQPESGNWNLPTFISVAKLSQQIPFLLLVEMNWNLFIPIPVQKDIIPVPSWIDLNFGFFFEHFFRSMSVPGGQMLAFGKGDNGRLGLGSNGMVSLPTMVPGFGPVHNAIIAISCFSSHVIALSNSGVPYTWGKVNQPFSQLPIVFFLNSNCSFFNFFLESGR